MPFIRLFVTMIALLPFASFTFAEDVAILQHLSPIQSVEFSPVDSSLVVSASDDNTIKLWDLDTHTATTFTGHTDKVIVVAFSPDGTTLASGSDDKTCKLWRVSDQENTATLEHIPIANQPPSTVTSVAFSPDGTTLATAGYQTVKLWDLSDNTVSHTFQHEDWVYAVIFSPNGGYLATIYGEGKKIKIWDVATKQSVTDLTGDVKWIGDIAFSPDSRIFVDAGHDGNVTLWSVSDWSVFGRISVYASIHDLAFSPDGKTLASAALGIDLWSVETGEKLISLIDHNRWVREVAFSADGNTLASSASYDGTLYVQDIETLLNSRPPSDIVRLIYFLPSDRNPQSDIDSKIEMWIKGVQKFYADMMEVRGYGRKTFKYETDENGKAVVHHITGGFTDTYYNNNDKWKVWDEIRDAGFDPTKNIYAAFMDFSEILDGLHCGTGGSWDHGGVVNLIASEECLDSDYGHWLAVHEFGHAFGLQHDYRDHSDLAIDLGGEEYRQASSDLMVSSACTAKWLDVHRYFNSGTVFYNAPTTIQMWPPRAADPEGIRLRFTVTDPDGLQQARLLATNLKEDYFAGRDYFENHDHLDEYILECESLNDTSTAAEFITTEFTSDNDTVVLRVIDMNGNFIDERFPIDTTALPEHVEDVNGDHVVNIQDLVIIGSNLGQTGKNIADVNEDGVVNIQDLVLVAGALGKGAAAPSISYNDLTPLLTRVEVQQWLHEARQMNLTDPTFQRGIFVLEQLLAALTPQETTLLPNYPNPFNPETWIPYRLAEPTAVSISIYSIDGHLVRTLTLGHQSMGIYETRSRAAYWDGKNALGEPVASGVYFYTLTAGDFTTTRKMLILK
ncbi:MAG: T9SS type A sorting domain-containing protein [Candidatus Poribacteria bacterium]|nr:T9SS type A sorting domain-containing protein [Candidatus Poribacteria bacterium]